MATTALGLPRPTAVRGSRPAAAAALLLAAAHLPMALGHLAAPWTAAVAVALLLTCGHCALALWRRPCLRVWWLAAAMAVLMFVLPGTTHAMTMAPGTGALTDRAAALLGGPLTSAARWTLLVLAGSALLRRYGRRPDRDPAPAGS